MTDQPPLAIYHPDVTRALRILSGEDIHQMEKRPLTAVAPLVSHGFARVVDRYMDDDARWCRRLSITPEGSEALARIDAVKPVKLTRGQLGILIEAGHHKDGVVHPYIAAGYAGGVTRKNVRRLQALGLIEPNAHGDHYLTESGIVALQASRP